jgi:hypothetical protein
MAKRISGLICALGIAFLVGGAAYAAQDTSSATIKEGVLSAPASSKEPPAADKAAAKADTIKTPAAAVRPSAATTAPSQTLQKKKTAGEDILEDEDLLLPEKGEDLPVIKAADQVPEKAAGATPDKGAAQSSGDTTKPLVDSSAAKAAAPATSSDRAGATSAAVVPSAAKPKAAATIEDARPINFARNLKEYRSPKLAMLLSLAIPGLGQVYIGKRTNYLKAGAYVAVEAAIIGVSAYYFNRGDGKYKQAIHYADSYYSFDTMLVYYNRLFTFMKDDKTQNLDNSQVQERLNGIYYDTITDTSSNFSRSYNHGHPSQEYYHTIENSEYIAGWKGCEPSLDAIGNATGDTINVPGYRYLYQRDTNSISYRVNLIDRTTGKALGGAGNESQYGYSPYQRDYTTMMNESNKFYKTATYVLFVIIVNHVASAVDALISAKSYNDALLGKTTLWDNLSVQPTTAFSGRYLSPGLTMRIRF